MEHDIVQTIVSLWDAVAPFLGRTLEAGALTAGAVEGGKLLAPSLFAGKEGDRSFQIGFLAPIAAKLLGATTLGWLPLLASAVLAPMVSNGVHDVVAPVADKVTKPVSEIPILKPILGVVEKFIAPFAKAFGTKEGS